MPVTHSAAPEVRRISERLIAEHHKHLANVRMEYLFQSEASRRNGKITFGTARKITGYNALLSTPDVVDDPEATSEGLEYFLITIAYDMWLLMPAKARVALIDHELSHCGVDMLDDDKVSLSMRPHEIEEFSAILKRHGLWRVDLVDFVRRVGTDEVSLWQDLPPEDTFEEEEAEPPFSMLRDGSGFLDAERAREAAGVNDDGEIRTAAAQGDPPEPPFE